MKTEQPIWKFHAQLGDTHPIDHGGLWVFTDETGVYPPEAELLISPDSDQGTWIVYRFILEDCTFVNGVLSDNSFHLDHPVWFADDLPRIASSLGWQLEDLIKFFLSKDPSDRAMAWQSVGDHSGFDNLDSYPLTYKDRGEVEARYAQDQYQPVKG